MPKKQLCKSCCGPLDEFPKKEIKKPGFCPYCVNEKGELKSYKEIMEGMIEYIKEEHKEIPVQKRVETAEKWLSEAPVWESKFVKKDVVIEDVRTGNIKDIPIMNKEKDYDCNACMYYMQDKRQRRSTKNKQEWFRHMEQKHGSCGKILYFEGEPVGYAQFAPKKEFIKLEDLKPGSTETDAWYISCIAIKKKFHGRGLGKLLLKTVLEDLEKRGVKKVQACGQLSGDASDFSSGYWSMYKKLGFKEIEGEENFKVGEKALNK